jgi:YHS domain-containing protein
MFSYTSFHPKTIHPIFTFAGVIITSMILSCTNKPQTEGKAANTSDSLPAKSETQKQKYTAAMVDNKKDPNCGMPVTAGIQDTVHYKGKVYGFCSDECRDAFLKNPVALAKAAELR